MIRSVPAAASRSLFVTSLPVGGLVGTVKDLGEEVWYKDILDVCFCWLTKSAAVKK